MLSIDRQATILEKLKTRSARVAVVGLGYVGLPRALGFASAGFTTLAIDVNQAKIDTLRKGENFLEPGDTSVARFVEEKKLVPTVDFSEIEQADAIVICVPTPLNKNREPDLQFVVGAAEQVGARLRRGQLVVLESTTFPGTTEDVVKKVLERGGLKAGEDFYLAFSPERIDPGNKFFDSSNTPKIVGGLDKQSSQLAEELYTPVCKKVLVATSPKVAEMAKLLENIFRCVNVALVNELALLCRRMEIDVWEVIELAATKPYGFMPFFPGPGIGGHCIPIDPYYLTWKAREYDCNTRFVELAGEINTMMPHEIVSIVADALGTHQKPLAKASVLVLGAAYKADVGDCRESPALRVMEILQKRGANVSYNDPFVPILEHGPLHLESVSLDDVAKYDCVVVATNHSVYDYATIVRQAKLVVDTRNATKAHRAPHVHVL